MPEICEIKAYPLDLPLKGIFETAMGSKTVSPSVVIELLLTNGAKGYGAATPVKYVTGEDIADVLSAIECCEPDLLGMEVSEYRTLFNILADMIPDQHSAQAGLEIAILDAFCKLYNLPMCNFFGGLAPEIETDITIPVTTPDEVRESAKKAASDGFRFLKMKVGIDPEADRARVIAASENAPNCSIRLDANQGFTPAAAVDFVSKLKSANANIDIFEQPVDRHDLEGLCYVTQRSPVPVFADESAMTVSDVYKLIRLDAVDGINVKIMKSGISGTLDIIALCQAAGKELMLGCMIETDIGTAAAVHLACGTGAFTRIDLDAHLLAAEHPFTGGFSYDGPVISVDASTPGHGSHTADV